MVLTRRLPAFLSTTDSDDSLLVFPTRLVSKALFFWDSILSVCVKKKSASFADLFDVTG